MTGATGLDYRDSRGIVHMLRYMVLGLLRRGERTHGYALWKAYERRSGHRIQNGKFYRALKGLVDAGFIQPLATLDGDPRRSPYEITALGSRAFDDWVIAFEAEREPGEDEISARALFILELAPPVADAFFAGAQDVLSARWKRLEHDRERVLSRPGISDRERAVQSLLLARNLERASADLTWLSEARATYTQLQVPAAAPALAPAGAPPARGRAARARA